MPDIKWNQAVWDRDYKWPADGDEWVEHAQHCGIPYDQWKESLARIFIIPYVKPNSTVLEIGPGHGRWTKYIVDRVAKGTVHLADLSGSCLEFLKKKYPNPNLQFHKVERSFPNIKSDSLDFVFSFDTFVHIEEAEVRSYAKELFRTMKHQAEGVIHHVGNPTIIQRQNGARSKVETKLFCDIFRSAGFFVIRQVDSWAGGNVKMASDMITVFVKP